ncbi:hypothetical protein PpBr36_00992 [Pyricularia pennisetigena]|uniref:hypothetical protein n=1 Tax=Pyricularia pennisetigena TaxID=1578925 RepID=UPI0011534055|nr:hypothetical protein PpBr36_00992 [Pyricularia pennisetigena]TLS27806.1 hypothetical protein PpBr36_00992 [Pyricularia pennisetigena]
MGPGHDGSDQPVVIFCVGGGHQGCSGFATLLTHAVRASPSGDLDHALFLVHNDAGRVDERGA